MVSSNDIAATSADAQDTPQEEVQEQPDAGTEITQLSKQVKKLEGDLKAANGRNKGRRPRNDESDNLVLSTNNEVRMLSRRLDTLMNAIGTGETDALPDEVSKLNAQQAQSQADIDYQRQWEVLSEDLVAASKNDDDTEIVNIHTAPELEQVRQDWTAAHQRRDVAGLARAVSDAQRVIRGVERDNDRATGRADGRNEVVDSGAFELDTGPSAGGSGMSDQRWLDDVYGADNYSPTSEDHKRAKIILDRMSAGV